MRIKIPLTGTLLTRNPYIGDDNDPVRIIDIDLGDVAWRAVSFDWENDLVEVEIEVPRHKERKHIVTPGDPNSEIIIIPAETDSEYGVRMNNLLTNVQQLLLNKTKSELYAQTGSARLKKPKL